MSMLVFRATVDEVEGGGLRVAAYYELFVGAIGKWHSFTRRVADGAPREQPDGIFAEVRAVEFYNHKSGRPELEMRLDAMARNNSTVKKTGTQLTVELSLVVPLRWESLQSNPHGGA